MKLSKERTFRKEKFRREYIEREKSTFDGMLNWMQVEEKGLKEWQTDGKERGECYTKALRGEKGFKEQGIPQVCECTVMPRKRRGERQCSLKCSTRVRRSW